MKELRKLNHQPIQASHELAALKISKEMAQSFAILESPAMHAVREITQSLAFQHSAAMHTAREAAQILAFQDSTAMNITRETAHILAFQDSTAMNIARETAHILAFQDSTAMNIARETAHILAFQDSTAMNIAREIAQSFALQESAAMKFARDMALLFAVQDSSVITEHINKLLPESSDNIEVNDESVEQAFVKLSQVTSSNSNGGFLSWYDNQPASTQLIVTLILSYFLNIFSNLSMPLYESWEHLFETETPRGATKLISQSANKEYDINELSDYRFVVASILNVRVEPSTKSEVVDELKNGMIVKFLAKSKRWTQVEFLCDETGERKIGWVFSRYLRKFDLKSHI